MNKVCTICKESKCIDDFYKRSRSKDGLQSHCKNCDKSMVKDYYKKNKKKLIKYRQKWAEKNRERSNLSKNNWKKRHPEKNQKINQLYAQKNKEKIAKRQLERVNKSPKLRVNRSMSRAIYGALKGDKGGCSWESLVGYTKDDLKNHLESLFEPWMNWENYGKCTIEGPKKWNIDHIIPKSLFKYDSVNDEEFKLCWSLKNLQPKEATANLRKGNKYIG